MASRFTSSLFSRCTGAAAMLFTATSLAFTALPAKAPAAELIMLEQDGCAYCRRWHAEIGEVYEKTKEAKIAPIRFVDINDPWPEDLADVRKERLTPTFILMDGGIEIGRMRGYTGDEFWWFLLDELLEKLPGDKPAPKAG